MCAVWRLWSVVCCSIVCRCDVSRVVCCLLYVARCVDLLFVARCVMFVVCWLLFGGHSLCACCLAFAACSLSMAVCGMFLLLHVRCLFFYCATSVARRVSTVVRLLLFVVGCLAIVDCCMVFVVVVCCVSLVVLFRGCLLSFGHLQLCAVVS